jgi:amino acid adenylation domain-containing protein
MDSSVYARIADIARDAPGTLALLACDRKPATYQHLRNQIDKTARWLTFKGIGRNDRVAVVMTNGPEMASLFLGVSSVSVCAPLNPAYKASEFEFYLSDLKPKLVIVDAALESAVRAAAVAMNIDVVELHRKELGVAGSFELGEEGSRQLPEVLVDYAASTDVALVLHTSGTTSRPKIVPLTHENLFVSACNIAESLELSGSDRCLNIMPLFHVHGLVGAVLSSLSAGACVVCGPGYKVTEFFEWIAEFRPTWYTGVPTMHHGIVTRADANRSIAAAHSLRFIRSCSSALAPALKTQMEEIFGVPVLEAYGMTEAAHQMSCNGFPPRIRKPGSVGRSTGVEIAIMNDSSELLAVGAEGEVVIRGRNVTRGYENNPDANAASFTDGWFRTGDQGRFDLDGDLFLTGRIKELIVRGGEKIAPREIDEALLLHPAVEQVLAFALPDTVLGDRVAAAVVLKAGASVTELELREHAAGMLADFKVPEKIVFVGEIQKGPTGKPQRIGLAEKLGLTGQADRDKQRIVSTNEYCEPRNETGAQLSMIWREILKLDRAGIHDNFFDAGGDSILAGQLISRMRHAFGVELSAPRLFQFPTIAQVAEFIDKQPTRKIGDARLPAVSRDTSVKLTSAQQRMCFFSQYEPEIPVYNRPFAYRLKGSLDLDLLQRSLDELVKRHEILRTNYFESDGRFSGVVRDPHPVQLARADLSGHSALEKEAAIGDWLRHETARPFNLETCPVLRSALARIAPDDHVLLLVIHHIACDASSEPVIFEDLSKAYNGTLSDTPRDQYADYAAWQNSREAAAMNDGVAAWKKQLEGIGELCEIPGDFARPQKNRYTGSSVPVRLDADTFDRCKAIARGANTTVFTVLLAAFDVLVKRYTGVEDIVVGTPSSVRNHPSAQSMVGLFINTLALRTNAAGDPTFREFLDRVRDTVNLGIEHQEVPFDAVVEALRPDRSVARSALFQVMFEYRNIAKPHLALEGILAKRIEIDRAITAMPFDLTLDIEPSDDGLHGNFYYNSDLYERSTIEGLAHHFETLLKHAIQFPESRISGLRLSSTEEQAHLLAMGSQSASFPGGCLHPLFEAQVARSPDVVAVVFENESLTYRELNARANQLANYLRGLGVGQETLVGLYTERSLDMVVGLIGILKAGGAYLPIDTAYPTDRIGFMLEDAQVRVLLTQQSLVASLGEFRTRAVCLDTEWGDISREDSKNLPVNVTPDSLAYVIYTSGSTGNPKGCLVTHSNVVRLMQATEPWFHFNDSDVWTLFHSHAFDMSVWEVWGALLYGGRLVVVPYWVSRSPELFHQLLRDKCVTVLNQTPSAFRELMRVDEAARGVELSLRLVTFGGEALDFESLRPWFNKHGDQQPQLVNLYGITETTVHVTYRPVSLKDLNENRGSLIGVPIPDLSLHILDSQLQPTPIGVPGEICVGGAGVARGYLNRPDLTRERFIPNPFSAQSSDRLYRSGDLARRISNGDIQYLGRIDQQVKIRGFRVEMGEIEAALHQHSDIRHAVVVAHDSEGDKRLVAYIVAGQSSLSTTELRAFLGKMLPDHMLPSVFVVLSALPLTPHGKLDRRALPAPTFGNSAIGTEYVAAQTQVEKDLDAIWQESLGVERIGIRTNFFEIGGHSLTAMRVVTRIRRVFDLEVPVSCLFENPTIESLALAICAIQNSMHSEEDLLRILDEIEAMPVPLAESE